MSVTVQASKHPLKADWVYADVEPGQSIYEIAGGAPVVAYINGYEIPENLHRLTRIKDESHLTLWPVPQSDDILKPVLQIAVAVAAIATGNFVAGMQFAGAQFASYAAAAAVATIGNLAVNSLIPPQIPELEGAGASSFNRLASLTGQSNQVASFKPIPRLYGTFEFYPPIPMTARPYTEIQGNDQYLRMFLCLGYGPLNIGGVNVGDGYNKITETTTVTDSPVKIGETDINLFEEVEYEIGTPDQMTLYSDEIIENQVAFTTRNSGFDDGNSGTRSDGEFAVRTTETNTDEISLDIQGRLFSANDKAKTRNAKVRFKIEYRQVGASTWIVENDNFVISSSKKETVREGYRFKVSNGQYEVKLTRVSTTHSAATSYSNELTWTVLRSIRTRKPFVVPDTVVMDLRIRATDQLNGRIEDLSVLATSVLDAYDGSQWIKTPTNNPAWVFADIWSGTANRQPVEKDGLAASELLDWANYCDQEGLEYNGVFDSSGTTLERAQEVAGAGLASWQFTPDSKISVVRDVVQSVPKMVISPRNSFGFSYELTVPQIPDALRVQFVDDRTWENTERLVFDDGFDESNATLYETIQAKGVTNPYQAWKYGRYHIAQQRLRPERYVFNQDVQHLRYQRGDLLTLQQDVIAVGLGAGRIKEVVSDTKIVLDETISDIELGRAYGLKIQREDGSIVVVGVEVEPAGPSPILQKDNGLISNAVSSSEDYLLITDSVLTSVDNGDLFVSTVGSNVFILSESVQDLSVDDLVIFGERGKESIDVKVTEIQPQGDFTAQVTCVPAASEIEDAWDAAIPSFDPVLTEPVSPDRTTPKRPEIDSITSDESVLYVDDDGSLRVRMVVETSLGSFPGWDQKTQLRFRPVGDNNFESIEPVDARNISIFNVDEGIEYEVQARGVKNGKFSPWSDSATHTVVGKTAPPSDVVNFNAVQNGENVVFRWRESPNPDIEGYEIRFQDREIAAWETANRLVEANKSNTIAQADVPPGDYKFFIKALDTSGNFSENATEKSLVVKSDFEIIYDEKHSPDWNKGYYVGFDPIANSLQVSNSFEGFYVTDEFDVGFDADDVRVWADLSAAFSDLEEVVDNGKISSTTTQESDYNLITDTVSVNLDFGELIIGIPLTDPQVTYEIATRKSGEQWNDPDREIVRYGRITENIDTSENYESITDPVNSFDSYDTLMGWTQWTRGVVEARYIKHRARITQGEDQNSAKLLRNFRTVTDVDERIEKKQNQTVAVGGSTFFFDKNFHLTPTVIGTVESDNAVFPIRKSVSTDRVTFVVRDSSGNDVGANNFDFVATGA